MKSRIFLIALMVSYATVYSQKKVSYKPVSVGGKLPDLVIKVINSKDSIFKFSEHRGKLIIFDFWSTTCSGCIAAFPKLESLQKKYQGQIQIILVNKEDTKVKVERFLTSWETRKGKKLTLPTVVRDTLLNRLFPHRLIPHYVWVGTDGIVKAISGYSELKEEYVTKLLKGTPIAIPKKNDINTKRPLFSSSDLPLNDTLLHYSVFLKGQYDGLGSGINLRRNGKFIVGKAIRNTPILFIYEIFFASLGKANYHQKRLILNVSDSLEDIFNKARNNLADIGRNNLFTFEVIVPVNHAEKLDQHALDELNKYSGMSGSIEKRKIKCFALVRSSEFDKIKTGGGEPASRLFQSSDKYLKNVPLVHLVARLNDVSSIKYPVIDETNYQSNVDIIIKSDFNDIKSVIQELHSYDLDLIEVERELDMFLLTENGFKGEN